MLYANFDRRANRCCRKRPRSNFFFFVNFLPDNAIEKNTVHRVAAEAPYHSCPLRHCYYISPACFPLHLVRRIVKQPNACPPSLSFSFLSFQFYSSESNLYP